MSDQTNDKPATGNCDATAATTPHRQPLSFAQLEAQISAELQRLGSAVERGDFADAGRLVDLLNGVRGILGERRFGVFLRSLLKRHAPAFRRVLDAYLAASR